MQGLTPNMERPHVQATESHSAQNLSVQQAAAEILALVNASPRTPWPSEVEAIVAKAAQVKIYRDLDGPDVHDGVPHVDHAVWRKLVIEAEDTLSAKDLLVGDPRLPVAEATSDAAYERRHAFEAAIWARPARTLSDIAFLADLLVYQRWPGYALSEAFPGNDPVDPKALFEGGPWCEGKTAETALAALLCAIRDVIGLPKPDVSDAALLAKVRTAIVREIAAAQISMHDETKDTRITQEFSDAWDDLHAIQRALPYPPRTATQMLCHVEIAYHGADKNHDGTLDIAEDDCCEGTAGRLVEAAMAYFGGQPQYLG